MNELTYQRTIANPDGTTSKIRIAIECITPSVAKEYLIRDADNNRTIRPHRVSALSRDMENGNWWFNGAAIIFNEDGKLIDGQHRLKAIIQSGTPEPILAIRGVSNHAMLTIDKGKARTLNDTMRITENQTLLKETRTQSMIRRLLQNNIPWLNNTITDAEMLQLYDAFEPEIISVDRCLPRTRSLPIGADFSAACLAARCNGVDEDAIGEFVRAVKDFDSNTEHNFQAAFKWASQISKGYRMTSKRSKASFIYLGTQNALHYFLMPSGYRALSNDIPRYPVKDMLIAAIQGGER